MRYTGRIGSTADNLPTIPLAVAGLAVLVPGLIDRLFLRTRRRGSAATLHHETESKSRRYQCRKFLYLSVLPISQISCDG